MNSGLSIALERRLKLLPNRATIGVQAQIQDTVFHLPKFQKNQKQSPVSELSLIENQGKFKDEKIGTDPIEIESQLKIKKKISLSTKFRLKGVLAEENNDLQVIDQTNKGIKLELHKVEQYLMHRM